MKKENSRKSNNFTRDSSIIFHNHFSEDSIFARQKNDLNNFDFNNNNNDTNSVSDRISITDNLLSPQYLENTQANADIFKININEKEIDSLNKFKEAIPLTSKKYKPEVDKKEELQNNIQISERIIVELARQQEISFTQAVYGISDLYQKGAHLKNVQNRSTFINGMQLTKQNITQAMIRIGARITHRAMAKSMRDIIYQASKARDIPGNLFSQYKIYLISQNISLDPNIIQEHSYYCSDYHIDNPNTPMEVSRFLNIRTRSKNMQKNK